MILKQKSDMHENLLLKAIKSKSLARFADAKWRIRRSGKNLFAKLCEDLEDVAMAESPTKIFGRMLIVVLAPGSKKEKRRRQAASQTTRQAQIKNRIDRMKDASARFSNNLKVIRRNAVPKMKTKKGRCGQI